MDPGSKNSLCRPIRRDGCYSDPEGLEEFKVIKFWPIDYGGFIWILHERKHMLVHVRLEHLVLSWFGTLQILYLIIVIKCC